MTMKYSLIATENCTTTANSAREATMQIPLNFILTYWMAASSKTNSV